jgi:hypothetical protein
MEKETKKRSEEEEMNSRYEKQAQPEEVTEKLFENVRSGLVPQMEGFSPAIRRGLHWKYPPSPRICFCQRARICR